jgi:hypothetical protein
MIRSHSVEGQVSRIDERYLCYYYTFLFLDDERERTSIKYKANLVTAIMIIKKKKRERERYLYKRKTGSHCFLSFSSSFFFLLNEKEKVGNDTLVIPSFFFSK